MKRGDQTLISIFTILKFSAQTKQQTNIIYVRFSRNYIAHYFREETAAEPETKKRREDMCESERIEFDSWISDVRSKLQEIREKKAVRARRRKQIAKRRTAASQERMRIISHLARNNKVELRSEKGSRLKAERKKHNLTNLPLFRLLSTDTMIY